MMIFSDEVLSLISNRYAEQVLDLRPEDSGKRKHSPEWTKSTNTTVIYRNCSYTILFLSIVPF